MNKPYYSFWIILIGIVFFTGCFSNRSISDYDYTYLYDASQKLIKPDFKIFHYHKDSSVIYYQLESNNILYGRLGDSLLKARIWVKYKLYSDENKDQILDSMTLKLVNYGYNDNAKILQGEIKLKVPQGSIYPLEMRFRDENKDLNVIHHLQIDKRANNNNQYFILRESEKVLIGSLIKNTDQVVLYKSPLIEQKKFTLHRSDYKYSTALPPFAEDNSMKNEIKFDDITIINFDHDSFRLRKISAINKLIVDGSGTTNAFHYYHFYKNYPKVTDLDHLIQPIRYISTPKEYKAIVGAVNYKKAIDNFWLKLAKNEERAKKLIKEYYSRIENSNTFFSTYREGWKTDRGIIYTVYGTPNTVYKTKDKEVWIYGEENNILSLKFTFLKTDESFNENDFHLVRNSDYKISWYRAVDLWRQVKVL